MQIKVITRHTPNNYGSLLQSIATLRVIESLGHQCEIIDYWKRDEGGTARNSHIAARKIIMEKQFV